MSEDRTTFMGVPVDPLTMDATISRILMGLNDGERTSNTWLLIRP
jgi:hypothetical protein